MSEQNSAITMLQGLFMETISMEHSFIIQMEEVVQLEDSI